MDNLTKHIAAVVDALLTSGARTATKYVSERETVCARLVPDVLFARDRRTVLNISFGRPQYTELRFIEDCKEAGEPFPVKKVQLKMPAVRKGKGRKK